MRHKISKDTFMCHKYDIVMKTDLKLKKHMVEFHDEEVKDLHDQTGRNQAVKWFRRNRQLLPCHICGKEIGGKKSLEEHILGHGEPTIPCDICSNKYRSETALRGHIRKLLLRKEVSSAM